MKKWYDLEDLNAELVNILCFLLGLVMIGAGIFIDKYDKYFGVVLISVGSSIIASTVIV